MSVSPLKHEFTPYQIDKGSSQGRQNLQGRNHGPCLPLPIDYAPGSSRVRFCSLSPRFDWCVLGVIGAATVIHFLPPVLPSAIQRSDLTTKTGITSPTVLPMSAVYNQLSLSGSWWRMWRPHQRLRNPPVTSISVNWQAAVVISRRVISGTYRIFWHSYISGIFDDFFKAGLVPLIKLFTHAVPSPCLWE